MSDGFQFNYKKHKRENQEKKKKVPVALDSWVAKIKEPFLFFGCITKMACGGVDVLWAQSSFFSDQKRILKCNETE
ncbi:hypothetical protein F0562_035340 [Nyssa sinensis]|uniref:Uncharacterized protein n=1 Tax=Nyssa sinensis TaxID=561372 RepID=A0A5J5AEZ6_9ASTE|nr:hypothetical protein F0562_035340 [Nyssa sinensis]